MKVPQTKAQPLRQGKGSRTGERDMSGRAQIIRARMSGAVKQGYPSWNLTIPAPLVRDLAKTGNDLQEYEFRAELVPDGILFRVVGRRAEQSRWASSSDASAVDGR